ncbi:MAG: hypothetical protein K6E29_06835 [Cyanobacteria bacterium RUI128]|nr:hypothetical protein [Cyanobacteria bacterium RUI128]
MPGSYDSGDATRVAATGAVQPATVQALERAKENPEIFLFGGVGGAMAANAAGSSFQENFQPAIDMAQRLLTGGFAAMTVDGFSEDYIKQNAEMTIKVLNGAAQLASGTPQQQVLQRAIDKVKADPVSALCVSGLVGTIVQEAANAIGDFFSSGN